MAVFALQLGGIFPAGLAGAGFGGLRGNRAPSTPNAESTPRNRTMIRAETRSGDVAGPSTAARASAETASETGLDKRSDEKLLDAYMQGERSAFPTLMRRYDNELLHFLTRFLGSRAAADDVFQETFLQIHLSAETFDQDRRFKPWLFTIAANKARDYHRKHNRAAAASLSAAIDPSGDGDRFSDLLQSDLPDPDSPMLASERSVLVKKAVDSLPVHLREILLLSYFQGFSYNQIAESLEIPLGTVKSRLHAAVAAFARAWKTTRGSDAEIESSSREEDQSF